MSHGPDPQDDDDLRCEVCDCLTCVCASWLYADDPPEPAESDPSL